MSKFQVDDKVIATFATATGQITKHKGTVLDVITSGQYAGQYRVAMVDWLTAVLPEGQLEPDNVG